MFINRYLFLIFLLFYITGYAFAEVNIKAEVDKKVLTTDEALTYKIIIESSDKQVPAPLVQLPKFTEFSVLSRAQSSAINISGGKMKNSIIFAYIIVPLKIGKLQIEPAVIKVNNKDYSTDGFEIEVKQGQVKPQPKMVPEEIPLAPQQNFPSSDQTTL